MTTETGNSSTSNGNDSLALTSIINIITSLLSVNIITSTSIFFVITIIIIINALANDDAPNKGAPFESLSARVEDKSLQLQLIRLEHLCLQYLQNSINIQNVLTALRNADDLGLSYIKDYCLHYIIKDPLYSSIVVSKDFETVSKTLIIEIVRLRQNHNKLSADMISRAFDVHHSNTLESDMKKFLTEDDLFSDITLELNDFKFRGHRSILAARSSFFEAHLRSFPPSDGVIKIPIEVMIPQSLTSLLKYIYYGDTNMSPDHSLYLFSASSFFGFTNNRLQTHTRYFVC
ncbi:hypothetical protein HELRODRAFT_195121 [Helobdella robusta]|uniref:BTB domain-containing protein n=1 Tax=Helobdella robusta TaxID=6412 RepID=T1FWR9_HELRO|nr:hypothetical protein HELRODRAFT_195121 [Helobdella robusta]ESO00520.1 hypothetical protein HELRODRAFT_195121 [Helobdella robusta]